MAQPDRAPAGLAVLGHVGQGLGDHEVRGRLDGRVQPAVQRTGIELGGHGGARGQGGERLAQAAVDEDRRGDAARQGPQLLQRLLGLGDRVGQRLPGRFRPAVEVMLGTAQLHRQPDQPLLGPVVDVPLEPAQRGRLGRHRGDSLRPGPVPLLLQPADPALQRGNVRQQCLAQPGLDGTHARVISGRAINSSRPTVVPKATRSAGDVSPRLRAIWDGALPMYRVMRPQRPGRVPETRADVAMATPTTTTAPSPPR